MSPNRSAQSGMATSPCTVVMPCYGHYGMDGRDGKDSHVYDLRVYPKLLYTFMVTQKVQLWSDDGPLHLLLYVSEKCTFQYKTCIS